MKLRVELVGAPSEFGEHGKVRLVWQSRVRPVGYVPSENLTWDIPLELKDGRWTGTSIGRNSDGRRFLYFAWLNQFGQMFRRIKLYQDQVSGDSIRLSGTMPDGSPACSTARVMDGGAST